jgi:hypothetical protein
MRSFQLCEYKRVVVAGEVQVHGRLKVMRDGGWSLVGVFQLAEDEWRALTELCIFHGLPVTHDDSI